MITVYLPISHLKALDSLVVRKGYGSRNELIRIAITDLLKAEYFEKNHREER